MSTPTGRGNQAGAGSLALVLATCAGLGFLPGPTATYASFVVAALLWICGAQPGAARFAAAGLLLLASSAVGVWAAGRAERRYGSDPHCVVIDEVAGILLATYLIPWDLAHLACAFVLFRAFDVVKPPPVYQLQALRGGWGVVADDLAAGAYTLVLLALAGALLPGF